MTVDFLVRIFEHNNWTNQQIVELCCELSAAQLDAQPQSVTKGNIRETLTHLVSSQAAYLELLTLPDEERKYAAVPFASLPASVRDSGEGLLALARGERQPFETPLRTRDGHYVEPWVIMVQVIDHAAEHREQVCSMLNALGITPPVMDGWSYGAALKALVPIEK